MPASTRLKSIPASVLRVALEIADDLALVVVRSEGRRTGFTRTFETFAPPKGDDFKRCADYLIARGIGRRVLKNLIAVPNTLWGNE